MSTNTGQILDGKALAQKMQDALQQRIGKLAPQIGRPPGLAVLMVGDNPASAAYVGGKERACTKVGVRSFGQHFSADVSQEKLTAIIHELNADDRVDGKKWPMGFWYNYRCRMGSIRWHYCMRSRPIKT